MATIEELQAQLAALDASDATGVARATYQGRTVEYRSVEERERVRARIRSEIAALQSRRPVRVIYTPGSKYL